ncbi:hypothetical protein [Halococcus saccharolyticus]|nr:hypothetical protein [Halococcus saccharolyticus]
MSKRRVEPSSSLELASSGVRMSVQKARVRACRNGVPEVFNR